LGPRLILLKNRDADTGRQSEMIKEKKMALSKGVH